MTDPLAPWVTPAELRAWLEPSLRYAVEDDDEALRLIARAVTQVIGMTTRLPDRTVASHREAMAEAICLTIEQRIVTGAQGAVVGGRISIGHVTYGTDRQDSQGTPPGVPAAALYALRNAGLLSTAVVAY